MSSATIAEQTSLNNYGISFIGFDPDDESVQSATFVVVGVARSGTTMIARILKDLEVLAPAASSGAVLEDTTLAKAIEENDAAILNREIERRNGELPRWGTKRPEFYKHIPLLDRVLRHPRYIVTFRDPLAIAVRNQIAVHQDVRSGVGRAAAETLRLVESISRTRSPCLLISYEKALLYPEKIVEAIETFCGLRVDDARRRAVLAAIRPNEPGYIDAARFKYEGIVDGINEGRVWGWARRVGDMRPVEVELVGDGRVLATRTADMPRPDLKKLKGNCAFEIKADPDVLSRSKVVVRVKGTNVVLPNRSQAGAGPTARSNGTIISPRSPND